MSIPFRPVVLAAISIAVQTVPVSAIASEYIINHGSLASVPGHQIRIIEIAGADESDKATKDQLRRAGTEMVPDESLTKSSANPEPYKAETEIKKPEPIAQPQSIVPQKLEPTPVTQPEPTPAAVMEKPAKPTPSISGPYLRIDVGYGFPMDSDGSQAAGNLSNGSMDNAALFGGGIGYRINENFRSDVTISYQADADVSATTAAGNTTSTEVNGLSLMLNGYWDIAKLDMFTPYIGAGLGYARLSTPAQTTTGGIANEGGETSDNFAWAMMLGGSYELNSEAAFDVGYRFINMGEFKQTTSTVYNDLMVHEARAGFRYSF
jgi:opacity protein-like surface antigen